MGQVWSRGSDEEKFDSIDALLEATGAESPLQVGEELDLETESGLLLIIKITAVDEDTEKASFEIVSQLPMEQEAT